MSAVALDVTDSASIEKCKAQVTEITGGTLDILVNNAYDQILSLNLLFYHVKFPAN